MIFILFYFTCVIVMIFALVIDYVSINTTTTNDCSTCILDFNDTRRVVSQCT